MKPTASSVSTNREPVKPSDIEADKQRQEQLQARHQQEFIAKHGKDRDILMRDIVQHNDQVRQDIVRRQQEDNLKLQEHRKNEEQRRLEEHRKMEEQRRIEAQRRVEEQKKVEEQRKAEEQRRAEEHRRIEEQRRGEEQRRLEIQRKMEEQRRANEQKRVEEQRILDEQRRAETQRKLGEQRRHEESQNDYKELESLRKEDELRRIKVEKLNEDIRAYQELRKQGDDLKRQEEASNRNILRQQEQARHDENLRSKKVIDLTNDNESRDNGVVNENVHHHKHHDIIPLPSADQYRGFELTIERTEETTRYHPHEESISHDPGDNTKVKIFRQETIIQKEDEEEVEIYEEVITEDVHVGANTLQQQLHEDDRLSSNQHPMEVDAISPRLESKPMDDEDLDFQFAE